VLFDYGLIEKMKVVGQQVPGRRNRKPPSPNTDARPRGNHPFFLNPAMPGERLFVPQCL
jgi:hypothetical protein